MKDQHQTHNCIIQLLDLNNRAFDTKRRNQKSGLLLVKHMHLLIINHARTKEEISFYQIQIIHQLNQISYQQRFTRWYTQKKVKILLIVTDINKLVTLDAIIIIFLMDHNIMTLHRHSGANFLSIPTKLLLQSFNMKIPIYMLPNFVVFFNKIDILSSGNLKMYDDKSKTDACRVFSSLHPQ